MSEPTGDGTVEQIVADAEQVQNRPLPEQPDAYSELYDRLAAELSDQPDSGPQTGQ